MEINSGIYTRVLWTNPYSCHMGLGIRLICEKRDEEKIYLHTDTNTVYVGYVLYYIG